LIKFVIILFFTFSNTLLANLQEEDLKKMIGQMIIIGFEDEYIYNNSQIIRDINRYNLGGVILFDKFYNNRTQTKNISSPKQLQTLTSNLQTFTNHHIIISIDQEGGKVARLKPAYGFEKFPSAKDVSILKREYAQDIYSSMAKMISKNGINCNFAPVVDLSINPDNNVIVGLNRSFGSNPIKVTQYAEILIEAQKSFGIISVLKHFPGHGSSLADSHLGFVDISDTWSSTELEPYQNLINENKIDMIMTAHVFNKKLDPKYPATLSHNVNTKLLRKKMTYNGVIISDDLQMKAISKHYTLKETVTLAINAGVDILLFGNQLANQNIKELIETIYSQVQNNKIPLSRILESNKRIKKLYE